MVLVASGSVVVVSLEPEATKWTHDDRPRTQAEIDEFLRREAAEPPMDEADLAAAEDFARALREVREWSRPCDLDCPRRNPGPSPAANGTQPAAAR